MIKDKYSNYGVIFLGRIAAEHIKEYEKEKKTQTINELYKILVALGNKYLYGELKGIPLYLIDETISDLAEIVVMRISKKPQDFSHQKNFVYYYRQALRNFSMKTLKNMYNSSERMVHLDDDIIALVEKEYVRGNFPTTDSITNNRDACNIFIMEIENFLRKCPRYSAKYKYLIWPITVYLLDENKSFLDSLNFRDRIGLKTIAQLIVNKVPEKSRNVYERLRNTNG